MGGEFAGGGEIGGDSSMKCYTDGKAMPFSSIVIDGVPVTMLPGQPQFFVPLFSSREALEDHMGGPGGYEVELELEGIEQ